MAENVRDVESKRAEFVKELLKNGFVFIREGKPYYVNRKNGWLYYHHPDNMWVTLRKLERYEITFLEHNKIPEEHAALYHKKVAEAVM